MRVALLPLPLLLACSDYAFVGAKDAEQGAPPQDSAPPEDSAPPDTDAPVPSCPTEARPSGAVAVDDACIASPTVGSFSPVIEWQWSSNPSHSGYAQNMATPAVGRLRDTNGDGIIGEGDVPDVVFTSYTGGAYSSAGTLTAAAGDGIGTRWSVMAPGGQAIYGAGGVALGDLDGDGTVEVCAAGVSAAVVCVNGVDGSLRWAAGAEPYPYGAPALADIDGDGLSEVIFGRQVFNHDGSLRWIGAGGLGGAAMSFAVDWDGDPGLEIVAGSTVYDTDGAILWSDGRADGVPAVADVDGDGRPEMIRVGGGLVRVSGQDGAVWWEVALPGGGNGGAPVVADLDGDGLIEIGVAALSLYTVFEHDGAIKWSRPTEDDSSSITGASVFDFEGDGDAELVYADEHNLYVYDGATGDVLLVHDGHASGTLFEYPVIADVDGDGATEIVVSSNNMWWAGWTGITVIGDADNSWAPARPIWNQFAYHITNIEDDGGVPVSPAPNWASWNTFRAGGTVLGPGHWRPNLRLGPPELCLDTCGAGTVSLWVPVENDGLIPAGADTTLELRLGSPGRAPFATHPVGAVSAGEQRWIGPLVLTEAEWSEELFLRVDGLNLVDECDEADNVQSAGAWPCP
ncbi:MAG: hypothetical protein JNM72_27380 [Deltaproteobacteria bacterium]|jgi:hypothetical protein|nr:hypothetical protein [Deltaproteobacteria bacterium]